MAGGNPGMNYPLSEIVSWVLEPVASAIKGSVELISGEDLKSKIDSLNTANESWAPDAKLEGSLANREEMKKESATPPKICD